MRMEESILSANGFGNLETSARDAVRQIMDVAGIDDLSDVQNAIRTGAMRVSLSFNVSSLPFPMWRAICGGVGLTLRLPIHSSATSSRGMPKPTRRDASFVACHVSLRPDSGNIAPADALLHLLTNGHGMAGYLFLLVSSPKAPAPPENSLFRTALRASTLLHDACSFRSSHFLHSLSLFSFCFLHTCRAHRITAMLEYSTWSLSDPDPASGVFPPSGQCLIPCPEDHLSGSL